MMSIEGAGEFTSEGPVEPTAGDASISNPTSGEVSCVENHLPSTGCRKPISGMA